MKLHTYILSLVAMLAYTSANAVPTLLQSEDWESGDAGWTVQEYDGAGGSEPTPPLSVSGGQLVATFGEQDPPLGGSAVIAADGTSSGGIFTGNYNTMSPGGFDPGVKSISFQFTAIDEMPSDLGLYFYNSGSGRTWQYNLTDLLPGSVGEQGTYSVLLNSVGASSWHIGGPIYNLADLQNDLANVSWIGVYISRNGVGTAENYHIDNFELWGNLDNNDPLAIPEPGTILVLLAALIPMAVSFRGQLAGLLGWIKGLIH